MQFRVSHRPTSHTAAGQMASRMKNHVASQMDSQPVTW